MCYNEFMASPNDNYSDVVKSYEQEPFSEFSAWDDLKFIIGGLLALLSPILFLALLWFGLF